MKSFNSREISHRTCHIIRDERIARDLTQIEMANALGISQSALSKIENLAMMPTLIPWLRFCSAFSLPADLPLDEKQYKIWAKDLDRKNAQFISKPAHKPIERILKSKSTKGAANSRSHEMANSGL